ncbi:hypothetical protein C8F04DRAFT_1314834 [Mycena alexandri]|uniref:DNA 3'-5' helicase n=1 Tax=Mycena alexandri TaxID=1745969 RepID=A0AAD6S4V7_9AGAR|nr:hypothetical protein C8F04DRAFT_1314834 [Mycena alexandri]
MAPPDPPFPCDRCNGATITQTYKYHERVVHQTEALAVYPNEGEIHVRRIAGLFKCLRCDECEVRDPSKFTPHTRLCYGPNPLLIPTHHLPPPPPPPASSLPRQFNPAASTTPADSPPAGNPPSTSTSRSAPASDNEVPDTFSDLDYVREPDEYTITEHAHFPLQSYSIFINILYHFIGCLNCGKAIAPNGLAEHIRHHFSELRVDSQIGEKLVTEFDILNPHEIPFPKEPITPVFGLRIFPRLLHFCKRCGHGYADEISLMGHQSNAAVCPRGPGEVDESFIAHGQSFGLRTSYFPVDPTKLMRRTAAFDPAQLFAQTLPPPVDYSKRLISVPINNLDLDLFLQKECWQEHAIPQIIPEYLAVVQSAIKKQQSQGFLRKMAQVGSAPTYEEFRALTPDPLKDYGRELVRLLSNLLIQVMSLARVAEYYPMTPEQHEAIRGLYNALNERTPQPSIIAKFLHEALFALFAHEKEHGGVGNEWMRTPDIGGVVAKLMWCTRGVMLYEMEKIMVAEKLKTADAYEHVKKFLIDGEDTVMAYLYNMSALIRTIRGDDFSDASCDFSDVLGRELRFKGKTVTLEKFKATYDGLTKEYNDVIAKEIFFGEPIPPEFFPEIDIRSLYDDPSNKTAGFSMFDDPRNGFTQRGGWYGKWLLSCPIRAERFTIVRDGKVIWKTGPSAVLLRSFSKVRLIGCVRNIVGAGPSIRATEMSRDLARNAPGGNVRSGMILYHNWVIVGMTDKTSRRTNKKTYTPKTPPTDAAIAHINEFANFRAFETELVRQFFGDEEAERYHMYMWPNIGRNITGDEISDRLGVATLAYMKVMCKIRDYRSILSAFLRFHKCDLPEDTENEGFDTAQNHSTTTSLQRYGVDRYNLARSDPRKIIACMNTLVRWQRLIKVEGKNPVTLSISKDLPTTLMPEVAAELGLVENQASGVSTHQLETIVDRLLERRSALQLAQMKEILTTLAAELAAKHIPKPPPAPLPSALLPESSVMIDPTRLLDLRSFLRKPNAIFRSPQQGELLEKMQARQKHIIAAKMYDEHLITLVILPLSGLHRDLHRRAVAHGIAVSQWKPRGEFNPSVSLVYVSVEHAVDLSPHGFLEWAQGLAAAGRISRTVFDEAELLLTASKYREVMHRVIRVLIGLGVHVTLLIGTAPPHLIPDLREITGIHDPDIIRMRTSRPNIFYAVTVIEPEPEHRHNPTKSEAYLHAAVAYIKARVAQDYEPEDRAMVFCRTKAVAKRVGELLELTPYTSETAEDARDEIFGDWVSGRKPIIVCTSILGLGVDQQVRDVVHCNVSWDMIGHTQEQNRAGRGNLAARAILFITAGLDKFQTMSEEFGANLLLPWAYNKLVCRRVEPSRYLDGAATTCLILTGAIFCDNCEACMDDPSHVPPAIAPPTPVSTKKVSAPLSIDGSARLLHFTPVDKGKGQATAPNGSGDVFAPAIGRYSVPWLPLILRRPNKWISESFLDNVNAHFLTTYSERDVYGLFSGLPALSDMAPPRAPFPPPWWIDPYAKRSRPLKPIPAPLANPALPAAHTRPEQHRPASTSNAGRDIEAPPRPPVIPPRPPAQINAQAGPSGHQANNPAPRLPAQMNTPAAASVNHHHRPAQTNAQAGPPVHRANHNQAPRPGLDVQIDHARYQQEQEDIATLHFEINDMVKRLLNRCSSCWARGLPDWALHTPATCEYNVCNNRDVFWKGWIGGAFRTPGHCWKCCRKQIAGAHEWLGGQRGDGAAMSACPYIDIIKNAVYAMATQPTDHVDIASFDFVPEQVRDRFTDFWAWAAPKLRPNNPDEAIPLLKVFHALGKERNLLG